MEELEDYTLSEQLSLADAVASEQHEFPILVYTCGNSALDSRPDYDGSCLPLDSLMLLERHAVVRYAHLKVLAVESEEATIQDRGAEFACEYSGFVDEEILVPVNYPGLVEIIHPPRRRRRYAEVSEVITDLPRFLRVDTDSRTTPPPGTEEPKIVPRGTVLEITNVVRHEHMDYFEGTASNKEKYTFREDSLVNATAIPDTKKYAISDVLSMLLPKVVKFAKEPSLEEAIDGSSTKVNNTLVMTYGPLQLLGSKKREMYVGWLMEHSVELSWKRNQKAYKIALIPNTRWKTETVKLVKFPEPEQKQSFLARHFPFVMKSQFIDDGLYSMRPDNRLITSINSNVAMPDIKRKESPKDVSPSSAAQGYVDLHVYDEPAPPIPQRVPIVKNESREKLPSKTSNTTKFGPDILHIIAKKTRMGFGQVHKEILILFHGDTKKLKLKKRMTRSISSDKDEVAKTTRSPIKRSTSDASHVRVGGVSRWHIDTPFSDPWTREHRPLPAIPGNTGRATNDKDGSSSVSVERGNFDSDFPVQPITPEVVSRYEHLILEDEGKIMSSNQSIHDFCAYSVKQVTECFRLCALDSFSKICDQQCIDGAFLASFDLKDLKNAPFNLTEFQIRKVRKIIHDGWRPIYETIEK